MPKFGLKGTTECAASAPIQTLDARTGRLLQAGQLVATAHLPLPKYKYRTQLPRPDDPDILEAVRLSDGIRLALANDPRIVILDLQLPDAAGVWRVLGAI